MWNREQKDKFPAKVKWEGPGPDPSWLITRMNRRIDHSGWMCNPIDSISLSANTHGEANEADDMNTKPLCPPPKKERPKGFVRMRVPNKAFGWKRKLHCAHFSLPKNNYHAPSFPHKSEIRRFPRFASKGFDNRAPFPLYKPNRILRIPPKRT